MGASQFRATLCAELLPVKLTTAVEFEDELVTMVSWPVAFPEVVGSNCRSRLTDWPGLRVSGNVWPDAVNPAPVIVADLTVTLPDPVEVNFNDWEVGVFKGVLPKAMLVALIESAAVPVFNCRETFFVVLPLVAVNVTD